MFYFLSVRSRAELTQLTYQQRDFSGQLLIPSYFSCLVGRISGECASPQKSPELLGGCGERQGEREGQKDWDELSPGREQAQTSHFSIFMTGTNVAGKCNI